jgi:hypothetical protein
VHRHSQDLLDCSGPASPRRVAKGGDRFRQPRSRPRVRRRLRVRRYHQGRW